MSDRPGSTVPAKRFVNITKSDATVIETTRGIFVGGAGDLTVRSAANGDTALFVCQSGQLLPIECDKVLSTGTTATGIVALY